MSGSTDGFLSDNFQVSARKKFEDSSQSSTVSQNFLLNKNK